MGFFKDLRIIEGSTEQFNGRVKVRGTWVAPDENGMIQQYASFKGPEQVDELGSGVMTALQALYEQRYDDLPQNIQDTLNDYWDAQFDPNLLTNTQLKKLIVELSLALYKAKKDGVNLGGLGPYLDDFVTYVDAVKEQLKS